MTRQQPAHCCLARPRHRRRFLAAVLTGWYLGFFAAPSIAQVQAGYLYTLSNFSGKLRYDWVRVTVDPERDEVYMIYQDLVRIFNASGMEVFAFGDDLDVGHIVDAAVDANGDVILLSSKNSRVLMTRCNFRGVPIGEIAIQNLPPDLEVHATRLIYRNGVFYLVSLATASVIVADSNWRFQRHIVLSSLLDSDDRLKGDSDINGFAVGGDGSLFFTLATVFKVYKLSPDGKITSFGRSGSAPGRFGVIAGVATDSQGNVLVADKLKCVVMVFDKDFKLLTEFGFRGPRPENLIVPDDIAVDRKDRVYVTQGRSRGVSVFALTH